MTQTVVPAPPRDLHATPSDPAPPARSRVTAGLAYLRHILDGTPGRLRLISALCVIAAVLAALGGAAALNRRASALDDARASAQHLILLQRIQTNLVQADADATNAFLQFGLQPLAAQQDYLTSIQAASRDLAVASQASTADADALGTANVALTRYTSYIASAKVNSTIPLGASYLQAAGTQLRSTIVPALEKRSTADREAITSAFARAGNARWWLALAALFGLGVLVYAQLFLARHTHRYVNVPAAAATVGLLVVLVGSGVVMASAQRAADEVRDGALTEAIDISTSRVAAFDAKSREALTLIVRGSGSGPTKDQLWQTSFDKAKQALPRDLGTASQALSNYQARHLAIRKLDTDENRWRDAVDAAKSSAKSSANGQFAIYADNTEKALSSQAEEASTKLGSANDFLGPAAILVLLAGLLAAAGAWWGISLRLDEYR